MAIRKPQQTKKLHRLVQQAKAIAAFDKSQAFEYVRNCLTPPLDKAVEEEINRCLRKISTIYANLGRDSTEEEIQVAKGLEAHYMGKIKEIAPDYYRTISGNT